MTHTLNGEFRCSGTAPDGSGGFEHVHLEAFEGQGDRRGEPIWPGSDHDGVNSVGHADPPGLAASSAPTRPSVGGVGNSKILRFRDNGRTCGRESRVFMRNTRGIRRAEGEIFPGAIPTPGKPALGSSFHRL